MPINKDELTKELVEKAMQCRSADELMALAKTGGFELTREEAEAYMAELTDVELHANTLKHVVGRQCYGDCRQHTPIGFQ